MNKIKYLLLVIPLLFCNNCNNLEKVKPKILYENTQTTSNSAYLIGESSRHLIGNFDMIDNSNIYYQGENPYSIQTLLQFYDIKILNSENGVLLNYSMSESIYCDLTKKETNNNRIYENENSILIGDLIYNNINSIKSITFSITASNPQLETRGELKELTYIQNYFLEIKTICQLPSTLEIFETNNSFNYVAIGSLVSLGLSNENQTRWKPSSYWGKISVYNSDMFNVGNEYGEQIGYDKGYQKGYQDGQNNQSFSGIFDFIYVIASGLKRVLDIQILGHITIGHIVSVPIIFGLLKFFIGVFR